MAVHPHCVGLHDQNIPKCCCKISYLLMITFLFSYVNLCRPTSTCYNYSSTSVIKLYLLVFHTQRYVVIVACDSGKFRNNVSLQINVNLQPIFIHCKGNTAHHHEKQSLFADHRMIRNNFLCSAAQNLVRHLACAFVTGGQYRPQE